MVNPSQHGFCSEFYVVEKTIEVVVDLANQGISQIRIDALLDAKNGGYSTSAYIKKDLTVQPSGHPTPQPENASIWAAYDLPWTQGGTADDVLNRALGFLEERCT